MKKFPLAKPFIGKKEIDNVMAVLKSGVLSLGQRHLDFEKKFAKKVGTKYAVSVCNGTAGLHLALLAASIKEGDEVITSPFSFIASSNAILYVGARPVFVDVDPVTGNIDPEKIEEKINKNTKAILAVHIFGQPARMDEIMKIAREYKLKVIEDACESIEATFKGQKVGTFGESAVFAFYPNKQMTTGEGGILTTNSLSVYEMCKSLANQGRGDSMQWLDHKYLGYNYRMDEMSAALGLAQLGRLSSFVRERQKIAGWYKSYLSKYADLIEVPVTASDNTHTWFVYVVRLKIDPKHKGAIIKELAKAGVVSKVYLPSIHLFDFYRKKFGYKPGDYPISEDISARSLALPFYLGLKEQDVQLIVTKLAKIVRKIS